MSQLGSLALFEGIVDSVGDDGTIYIRTNTRSETIAVPPMASGSSGAGFFMGKRGSGVKKDDLVLCSRVPGGSHILYKT